MWIVSIPLILVLLVALFLGAGIFEAAQVNIMPVFCFVFFMFFIVNLVLFFVKRREKDDKAKKIHLIISIASLVFGICSIWASVSIEDIVSWIWYHI